MSIRRLWLVRVRRLHKGQLKWWFLRAFSESTSHLSLCLYGTFKIFKIAIPMSHSQSLTLNTPRATYLKQSLTESIVQSMLLTDRADPGAFDTVCIHLDDVRRICDGLTPVVYVDQTGGVVSRVSDEQFEAVVGPYVDTIRRETLAKSDLNQVHEILSKDVISFEGGSIKEIASLQKSLDGALRECEFLREKLRSMTEALPAGATLDPYEVAMAALIKPSKHRKQYSRKNAKARSE